MKRPDSAPVAENPIPASEYAFHAPNRWPLARNSARNVVQASRRNAHRARRISPRVPNSAPDAGIKWPEFTLSKTGGLVPPVFLLSLFLIGLFAKYL